jgi:radical SAM superfamily enzyme YgiQ (UPF0313 family)
MKKPFHVVICVLNSKYIHSSLAPWCLLAGVNAFCREEGLAGITAEVVEGTINEPVEEIAEKICAKNPQVIGFSCYIWNITATMQLLRLVKSKLPDAIIVLGGPEVSFNAEEVLREESAVQYVVSGEGEKPFALLLQAIHDGIPQGQDQAEDQAQVQVRDLGQAQVPDCVQDRVQEIPGVCSRKGQEIVVVPPELPAGDPPSPYSPEYFTALKGRLAYLETSRGCPYSCAFCLSSRGGGVRFFDLERTKKEMLLLANSGTQTVKLVDRTFNCNRPRAMELFRFIIENYGAAIPRGVCFHFEIAGDLLDEEMLSLLATAPIGAMQMEIGLQSFNPQTLATINRKTDPERLQRNIKGLVANGNMHIHIDLIAGLPFEDIDSFAVSFNTAYGLKPHLLQLGFLKLLHGAPMREEPAKFPCRYREEPSYEVLETPWLSTEELVRLHHTEDALERLYNSGRFRRTLAYVLEKAGYSPFTLFAEFGEFAAAQGTDKISLDDYTALAFNFFSKLRGINRMALRDVMVCDRLTTNKSGRLPVILRVPDAALKKVINRWNSSVKNGAGTRQKSGVKRSFAYLYSEHCLVYVDYQEEERNPITGEYPLKKCYKAVHSLP